MMHELAHFLLDHKPKTIIMSEELDIAIRSFDAKQEDQRRPLHGSPREGLADHIDSPVSRHWITISDLRHGGATRRVVSKIELGQVTI
jgi:hypothetical protein